ncbi:Hypothetical protein NTJ_05072 [Nesidiocoris tenuis]|uniref:Secreted protein n=1 Tax=Nesidiocoris tenuis TaxID=355587 RepID=A0ABN7AJ22_9HEMI|nr:Hypothetical protein NTJ_05072 [Nesidiocoris tenuis]
MHHCRRVPYSQRLMELAVVAVCCISINHAHPSKELNVTSTGNTDPESSTNQLSEALHELQIAEQLEQMNSTRESRGLLKKVAFLAGMRVGGYVQSSGTLSASNSLRVFGKVLNSAVSLSYGTLGDVGAIPTVDDGVEGRPAFLPERPEVIPERPVVEVPANAKIGTGNENTIDPEEIAHRQIKSNFLKQHNDLVDRANANNRYLRSSRSGNLVESVDDVETSTIENGRTSAKS